MQTIDNSKCTHTHTHKRGIRLLWPYRWCDNMRCDKCVQTLHKPQKYIHAPHRFCWEKHLIWNEWVSDIQNTLGNSPPPLPLLPSKPNFDYKTIQSNRKSGSMHPIVNNWLKLNDVNEQNLLIRQKLISCILSMLANRCMKLCGDWDIVLEW